MKKGKMLWAGLLAFFLYAAQSIALVHALEYGDKFHEHEGQPCALSWVLQRDDAGILPEVPQIIPPTLRASVIEFEDYERAASLDMPACRNKGPPLSF